MPNIIPTQAAVSWPKTEGTLGVVGVAPWATLEFCRIFLGLFPASKDWDYPRLLVDYNSKIPSRGRFLELGEADPSPFISATIQELSEAGASVAVVPCNTAHIFFESWSSNSNIPVINIIEATSRKAKLEGMTRVIVLSSKNLSFSGTYSKYLARVQIEHELVTDEFQQIVDRTIGLVKLGEVDGQEAQDSILRLISYIRSKSVSGIILGCTELGVFVSWFREAGIRVVDSGLALAEAARLSIYE